MVRRRRGREHGYNLVVLGVAITVMTIAVATALPAWSGAIRREKEEELIFRGLQIAEGIRVFQRRFGRPPANLEELFTAEPRSVRQKWKDPMSEDGAWAVITAAPRPARGSQRRPPTAGAEEPAAGATAPDGRPVAGPLVGVRSTARGKAMKTFDGATEYAGWRFTVDLLQPGSLGRERRQQNVFGVNVGGQGGPSTKLVIPNANWIGRPFRSGVSAGGAPIDGTAPTTPTPSEEPGDEGDASR